MYQCLMGIMSGVVFIYGNAIGEGVTIYSIRYHEIITEFYLV